MKCCVLTGLMVLAVTAANSPAAPGEDAVRITLVAAGPAAATTAAAKVDLAEVHRKIAALASEDDTIPYEERPEVWLAKRRARILPQLVAALDDKNPKVAERCLYYVLRDVTATKELLDALILKAGDEKSPLRYPALRQLEKYVSDARVVDLLDKASSAPAAFPDPLVRARWAALGGHKDRAVEILKPLLREPQESRWYETEAAIRLLGEIGQPETVALLEPLAAGTHWELASPAYEALAKIEPKEHGLTKDQAAFLEVAGRASKESRESYQKRMVKLATLNVKEVRPFVMQMLRDRDWGAVTGSLAILTAWKDKEALPEIWRLVTDKERSNSRDEAVAAYFAIDDTPRAEKDFPALLTKGDEYANEPLIRGIVMADIPVARKVSILRAAQSRLGTDAINSIPQALRYEANGGRDITAPLRALMDDQTDLRALGRYCALAAADKDQRFGAQVRRALKLLSGDPAVLGPKATGLAEAAGEILSAAAAYDLKDAGAEVQKLSGAENGTIRAAAQAAGARLGVAGAIESLYGQLGDKDARVRVRAADALLGFRPADEKERAAREETILTHLREPSGDYAIRVLVTCGGAKSVKALEPLLDDQDAQRAVYAAWVLAQLPDKAAASKGLRRVAIFGVFAHQEYQQGSGIDFPLAPGILFHQTTQRLSPDPKAYASGEGPVRIPLELLEPFALEGSEWEFAIRSYRFGQDIGRGIGFSWDWPLGPAALDKSYVLLLQVMAAEDTYLKRLMVKGQPVAHFEFRQRAAKAIVAITKQKATYVGLAGETLDSEATPEPYADQDAVLAKFVVDQIEKAHLPARTNGTDWEERQQRQVGNLNAMVRIALEAVARYDDSGRNVSERRALDAIRQAAQKRGIEAKDIVPEYRE